MPGDRNNGPIFVNLGSYVNYICVILKTKLGSAARAWISSNLTGSLRVQSLLKYSFFLTCFPLFRCNCYLFLLWIFPQECIISFLQVDQAMLLYWTCRVRINNNGPIPHSEIEMLTSMHLAYLRTKVDSIRQNKSKTGRANAQCTQLDEWYWHLGTD